MKCILLCWILGVAAWAGQPTRVELAHWGAQVAQNVPMSAAVYVAATGRPVAVGTITFTADGEPIPKCEAVWVWRDHGAAGCVARFSKVTTYHIVAAYSGTADYDASSASFDLAVGKVTPGSYVAFDPPGAVYGGIYNVGATVDQAPGVPKPTGTFTFFEAGKELATVPIDPADDHARFQGPFSAGAHTVSARYNGDDLYEVLEPSPVQFTLRKAPPIVAISSTPAQVRQPVTITASVREEGAGGTFTFTGVPGCAKVPLQNGRASCAATFNSLGAFPVGAEYSGDSNLLAGSASMTLNVGRVVAGLYATPFPATPVYGQPVTFGVLALGAAGVPPPTGAVTFADALGGSGLSVLGPDGHTQWLVTPPAGQRVVTSTYNGDANYGTSQAVASVFVAKAGTSVTLSLPPGGPITAVVTPVAPGAGTPTGSVRFTRDGAVIGMGVLTPSATGAVATMPSAGVAGNLRADYPGDPNFIGSVSGTATVVAPKIDLTIVSGSNPAPAGPVSFTAVATPNPGTAVPSGAIAWTVDGSPAGGGALAEGRATISLTLQAGSHVIAAAYGGDTVYPAASASMTQVVTAPAGAVVLTANPQAPVYGQPITFTALLPAGASGRVEFTDGAVPLGSGEGKITVSRLAAGDHSIGARWAGDANWSAGSAQLALTVAKAHTATTLVVAGGIAAAQVVAVAPGAGTPGGSVRFADRITGAAFAVVPLDGGTASAPMPPSVSLATAAYEGDLNYAASVSDATGLLTVMNAASYDATTFAPGEIVTLFGPNLTGEASAKLVDAAGVVRGVDLLYATAGQASLTLPEGLPAGPASLTVTGMSAVLPVGRISPGLFTADATGHGLPAAQVVAFRAGGGQETGSADAIDLGGPGDAVYLILYGTGIRHFEEHVVCTIAGQPAAVAYAGPQGGSAGIDQVNVLLPPELKGTGRADVVVKADGVAANTVAVVFR